MKYKCVYLLLVFLNFIFYIQKRKNLMRPIRGSIISVLSIYDIENGLDAIWILLLSPGMAPMLPNPAHNAQGPGEAVPDVVQHRA